MKKFILTMTIGLMAAISVNAQTATEDSKVLDNTYVGVEAGVSTPLNFNSVFSVNPTVGIKFGKELTPVFGLEVEGFAVLGDNFYRYGVNNSILVPLEGAMNIHKNGSINTFVKATNVGLNGVINLSNLFLGYQGTPRFFEVKTNTGLGWLHYFGDFTTNIVGGYKPAGSPNALTAKTAVDFAFNFGKTKAHTVNVTPGIYWNLNEAGPIQFNKNFAQFGVMVGYTYHFKTSNGTRHFKTYDVGAMLNEVGRLNDELAKKPKEVEVIKYVDRVVINNNNAPATNAFGEAKGFGVSETVYFAFNSAELDARAKETLDKLGQNGIYVVDAYASSEGSTEYNLKLSQRRADAVKAYLESRGARVDSATGHGVQFGTTTGRVAVVKLK
jgi:outer membrane protein OmpA-like peptidoglycan-associated protein